MSSPTDEIVRAGRYRLGAELARGGTSVVYEATDEAGAAVVVKTLFDAYRHVPGLAEDFIAEANLVVQVQHPNVAQVLDAGTMSDGRAYIVMERLIGETLEQELAHDGRWSETHVLELGRQLAGALAAAHAVGVIHRDVRPENVFLHHPQDAGGAAPKVIAKLLDFGRAKQAGGPDAGRASAPDAGPESATTTALRRTSSAYAAPEYLDAEDRPGAGLAIDHRVDIFALGVTLHEAATGRVPEPVVLGRVAAAAAVGLPGTSPDLATSSRALLEIIERAIAPDPRRRYPTMDAMREAIEAVQAERRGPVRVAPDPDRSATPVRSANRVKVGVWIAGILVTLAAITVGIRCAVGF